MSTVRMASTPKQPRLRKKVTGTHPRAFMELCGYYQRFICSFATLAKPLIQLTDKNSTFRWMKEEKQTFCTLKAKLTTVPILAYPDPTSPFILNTDASDVGIRAMLSQDFD